MFIIIPFPFNGLSDIFHLYILRSYIAARKCGLRILDFEGVVKNSKCGIRVANGILKNINYGFWVAGVPT